MDARSIEVLVLGIGNVLWADEGFGVRAVEALHDAYACPDGVVLLDGGTQGLNLMEPVVAARRVILFDAIDFGLPPGTLKILRGGEVPAWSERKMSPHQTGFNDLLALAQLNGRAPEEIVLIGVQPEELADFGGSLRESVRARLSEAVAIAVRLLTDWGFAPRLRDGASAPDSLHPPAIALQAYEQGRPAPEAACRIGDARFLFGTTDGGR